jgi:CAAX protease family protein
MWTNFFHQPLRIHWSWGSALIGIVAAIPPFGFFIWTLHTKIPVFSHHRDLKEVVLRPWLGSWSILQLLIISLIAGISEEAFFRGAIQGGLSDRVGLVSALILASGLFGAFHLLSWIYGIVAALIGAYLGVLWIWTGNLLTPMITHALYDFVALVYLLRLYGAQ